MEFNEREAKFIRDVVRDELQNIEDNNTSCVGKPSEEGSKPKGVVMSVDDIGAYKDMYYRLETDGDITEVQQLVMAGYDMIGLDYLAQGNLFHDKASAEKESLKRIVKHKLRCEFGDDVCLQPYGVSYQAYDRVGYAWDRDKVDRDDVDHFFATLTEEERESLR